MMRVARHMSSKPNEDCANQYINNAAWLVPPIPSRSPRLLALSHRKAYHLCLELRSPPLGQMMDLKKNEE